jgi:Ca2+-binding RTX toxin-like protein
VTDNLSILLTGNETGIIEDGTHTLVFSQIENVFSGSGDDTLDASDDAIGLGLFGRQGNDQIIGGMGGDYIVGGDGADTS